MKKTRNPKKESELYLKWAKAAANAERAKRGKDAVECWEKAQGYALKGINHTYAKHRAEFCYLWLVRRG